MNHSHLRTPEPVDAVDTSCEALPPAPRAALAALGTPALCAALERLCETERRTEWLVCHHLAELASRFEQGDPELGGYADVYQLARLRFGMGVRRLCVAMGLRPLALLGQSGCASAAPWRGCRRSSAPSPRAGSATRGCAS